MIDEIRYWKLSIGPARVAIATPVDLDAGVSTLAARGEKTLFRLESCTGLLPGIPSLAHQLADPDDAGLAWIREHKRLTACGGLSPEGLLHLGYLLLETELQRQGYVTLHGAAACFDDRAVLLLGPAGSGKTTTLLRMCRDHGAALIGNDLVIVGGSGPVAVALAGSRHVRLRHASLAGAMPDLLGLFPGEVPDPWRAKRNVDPSRLGITVALPLAEVEVVAFIHVDAGYQRVVDEPGDTQVHRLNLYENALRYIRGASTPWLTGDSFGPYVPPLDDETLHGPRTRTLEKLMARSRYIAGPPAATAGHLAALLSGASEAAPAEVA